MAVLSRLKRRVGAGEWADRHLAGGPSVWGVFRGFVRAAEFRRRWDAAARGGPAAMAVAADPDAAAITAFDRYTGPGRPGFVTDFLGTRTRVAYAHPFAAFDGAVEGYPVPGNFHAPAVEWAGVLRSVLEARDRLVVVEGGAGWGPWLVACAAAAARRGIADVRLVGVEAAAPHFASLRTHFADNGLDPARHTLLRGAVAAADGEAEFPDLDDPPGDFGGTLATNDPLLARVRGRSSSRVPAYSLATLIAPLPRVDLIHLDVQGVEADAVAAARPALRAKVRRLVVGTHGRAVEQRLLEDLSADGWALEADLACRYGPYDGGLALAADGCQVWANPAV